MADEIPGIPPKDPAASNAAPATKEPGAAKETSAVKERKFPCKSCGSDLLYAPGQSTLKCPYCGHTETIPQSPDEIKEYSYNDYLAKPKGLGYGAPATERRDAKCKNCGAQIQLDANLRATKCPFCGSPMITDDDKAKDHEVITPEAVVPFAVTRSQAEGKFSEWLSGLWFAPNALTGQAQLKQFQGVYRPYWTYDSQTNSDWAGERGDYYYVTETYTEQENGQTVTKTREVRHTRWTSVSGVHQEFFDDVLIPAGKSNDLSKEYDLKKAKHYGPEYLSGFIAERYSIPLEDGWKSAKKVIDNSIHSAVVRKIGGDEQRVARITTAYNSITFKHILLPLWINAYLYGNESYIFEVNGQTGKATGTRPYSYWKIAGLVAVILLIVAVLVYVFGGKGHSSGGPSTDHYDAPKTSPAVTTVKTNTTKPAASAGSNGKDTKKGDKSDGATLKPYKPN